VLSEEPARNLQLVQTFKSLRGVVLRLIAQRRERDHITADILGMLMEARDRQTGRAMPDGQLVSEILTLIVAGHETTASTLNWAWYLLCRNPATEEKLTAELAALTTDGFPGIDGLHKFVYTRHVLEEALRLYPAGWLMTRKALRDDQLGDYFLAAGTEVYISPYLIQRNPALWDRPDCFDPDRFDSAAARERGPLSMLPFSAGPRKCIGESFARMEMQVHLMTVAANLHLQYTGADPMELDVGVNLRGKHDFIMLPQIRGTPRSQPSGGRPAA
jgi:cytochrome P450